MTVMTPLSSGVQPRARSKCGGSAWPGGRAFRLQRRAAPTHTAHAAVARKRSPAHLRMMMSETPPPSPSAGARGARCTERLEQRKAHDVFDIPTIPRRQRAQPGEHMWALGRAPPTPLVPSAQREAATGLPYRRPGPRRCTPSRRRERSARRRSGSPQAPGAQRPRHRRRARSARRRQLACWRS